MSANYVAAVPVLFQQCFLAFAPARVEFVGSLTSSGSSSGSSSSSHQAAASLALLVVLMSRSLAQLADVMEAAGPQLLFDSLTAEVMCPVAWTANQSTASSFKMQPFGDPAQSGVQGSWIQWQRIVLIMFAELHASLELLGMAPAAASRAGDRAAAPAAGSAAAAVQNDASSGPASTECGQADNSSSAGVFSSSSAASPYVDGDSNSNSNSSSEHVKWSYLLRLQESDPQWAAAAAGYASKWHAFDWGRLSDPKLFATAVATEDAQQLYADAVQLCRTLTEAAPIAVVCNNPSCQNLACVREAALACKACSSCGCRYCGVVCQRADWKRHKPACKRMAAAGQTCA
jgi:hypothetical protein